MVKIGIVTIPDYNNYGNRLQNYAVKSYFEEKGFYVNTLELNDPSFSKRTGRKIKLILKKYGLYLVLYSSELLKGGISHLNRYKKFENFTANFLNVRYCPDWRMENVKKIGNSYDYIVLGSDQIWHPTVNETPNLFFGLFVPVEKRRFFSPSFGVDGIEAEYCQLAKECLVGVKKISVREKAGRYILKQICDANVAVLCDPTLIISREKWEQIIKRPKNIPNEYILSYFLGPVNKKYDSFRNELSKAYGKEIYYLADKKYKNAYATGPSEFLYSIKNAEFVITDSFHAVVFSIIFCKPFIVCSRLHDDGTFAGLDSRIDVLLETFGLQDRKYKEGMCIADISMKMKDKTDILRELREKVDEYFDDMVIE